MINSIFIVAVSTIIFPVIANANAINWANGQWALDPLFADKEELEAYNCTNSPMQVDINADKTRYQFQHIGVEPGKADILTFDANSVTIKYDGEERVMDDGKQQIWVMHFIDEDHFAWVRQDWIIDGTIKGATKLRIRCELLEVS